MMQKYCAHCGNELKEDADICLSCGKIVGSQKAPVKQGNNASAVSTLSVVFGSLGFFPLIFIGAIVGFILALIGMNEKDYDSKNRSKVGLGLSIGSFFLWLLIYVIPA